MAQKLNILFDFNIVWRVMSSIPTTYIRVLYATVCILEMWTELRYTFDIYYNLRHGLHCTKCIYLSLQSYSLDMQVQCNFVPSSESEKEQFKQNGVEFPISGVVVYIFYRVLKFYNSQVNWTEAEEKSNNPTTIQANLLLSDTTRENTNDDSFTTTSMIPPYPTSLDSFYVFHVWHVPTQSCIVYIVVQIIGKL